MNNTFLGMALLASAAMSLPVTILSIRRRDERDASLFFTLLGISNAFWGLCQAAYYLVPNEQTALFFFDLRLVFVCCSSIFTYLFGLKSFRHVLPNNRTLTALFFVPVTTFILVISGNPYGCLRAQIDIIYQNGLRMVTNINGPWFWVHCLVSYSMMVMTARQMLMQFKRLPRDYRAPITIMLIALAVTAVVTSASVLDLIPYAIDPSPVVMHIAQIMFFAALYDAHSLDDLFTSRDAVFLNAGNAIFVVGLNGRIVDYNHRAGEIGATVRLRNLYDQVFDELLKKWIDYHKASRMREDASIITITAANADTHYQIARTEFMNKKGVVIGSFIEFKNITPIVSLIHTLQDFAYYDQLTGLLNRRSFTQKLIDYDHEQFFPIGLIMGDVNKLKLVNDTYGHAIGDILLFSITEILKQESPKRADWFRIGGDEFAAIVPNTTKQAMEKLVAAIQGRSDALDDPRFAQSGIALAFRVKTSMDQDLHTLLNEADRAMYKDKRNRRKG